MEDDFYWTTADGRKIALRDMTDSHLENTIAFCERRLCEAWSSYGSVRGDMAEDLMEAQVDSMEADLKNLEEEAQRRGGEGDGRPDV